MYACPKQSSSASSKKESAIVVLQESVTKISRRDSLHRRESAISHGSTRPQTETAGAHQWEKPVVSLRQRDIKPQRKKPRRQKERAASLPSSSKTFVCPKCSGGCPSRIGLYSHQQACKNWPSTFPTILVCEEWAIITISFSVNLNQRFASFRDCYDVILFVCS